MRRTSSSVAPNQPQDDELSLKDYLGLYASMFSPEHNIQMARGLQDIQERGQSDQYAGEQGYPNLAAMRIGQAGEEHKQITGLRQQAMNEHDIGGLHSMGALAAQVNDIPTARAVLEQLKKHYGLSTPEATPPRSALEDKLRGF